MTLTISFVFPARPTSCLSAANPFIEASSKYPMRLVGGDDPRDVGGGTSMLTAALAAEYMEDPDMAARAMVPMQDLLTTTDTLLEDSSMAGRALVNLS